jgi:hypothetical protein
LLKAKTWRKDMSTNPAKTLTAIAIAIAIAAGSLAVSSTADARTYRHHHYSNFSRPYFYPRVYARAPFYGAYAGAQLYPDDYGRYYGGSYSYRPEYRRAPIYNQDDATKFSRQLMGHGTSNF